MPMNPRQRDGSYLANMQLSMDRLAEYVAIAQSGPHNLPRLAALIDQNTQDWDRHPNQIILGVAMFMADFQRASGKSIIPLLKAAPRKWNAEGSPLRQLWLPGQ